MKLECNMRSKFRGFYTNNEQKNTKLFKDNNTLFVFDTNFILDLYRNNDKTQSAMKEAVKAVQSKIWLPYFSALEYQRKRLDEIHSQANNIITTLKPLAETITALEEKINQIEKTKLRYYTDTTEDIQIKLQAIKDDLEQFLNQKSQGIKEKNDQIIEHDSIRDWVDEIFQDRIGSKSSEAELSDLNSECQKRFENLIPPGFADKSKEGKKEAQFGYDGNLYHRAYGDFYVWKELLEKTKSLNVNTVFFITNDEKQDMVHKAGYIKTGAHASLREEIFKETSAKNFEILSTYEFITGVSSAYRLDINQENIRVNFNEWSDAYDMHENQTTIDTKLEAIKFFNIFSNMKEQEERAKQERIKLSELLKLSGWISSTDDENNE
ncbi:unnamed protein product [Commensalibacter communis]|nr:unnamed protein product [Commensalibacter communis]